MIKFREVSASGFTKVSEKEIEDLEHHFRHQPDDDSDATESV